MNSNNSQITLVSPEFEKEPALVMILSRDDIKQTVMRRRGGKNEVMYNVESDASLTQTSVYHPNSDAPIAVLELKGLFGRDTVTFQGEEKKRIKDWLSGYSPLQTFPISFKHNGRKYRWKRNVIKQIALFSDQDSIHPIAWYGKSRLRIVDGVLRGFKAFLALEEEAMEIQDLVVIGFLIAENKMRKDLGAGTVEEGRSLFSKS